MKIMNRKEFLSLPSGFVYSKYQPMGNIDGLYLKCDSLTNDWIYQCLLSEVDVANDGERSDFFDEAENGKEFELDLNCGSRDGGFEDSDMFSVYDKRDIDKLIARLIGIRESEDK